MPKVELFIGGNAVKEFKSLNEALLYAASWQVTGFITVDGKNGIEIRKGKRINDRGKWVSCKP